MKAKPAVKQPAGSTIETAPKVRKRASPRQTVASEFASAEGGTIKRARKAQKTVPQKTIDEVVREAVVARLDSMKANDLRIIDVRGKTSVCDFIVIASGTSTRHVKSMGDEVVVTAKKFGYSPLGVEGEKDAEWILVDLGDTVIHVMLPRTREFYQLERMWGIVEESRAAAAL